MRKRRNSCRAFVLLETIIVTSVLCVILIVLYSSYSRILVDIGKRGRYDNTEYIYKTELIRNYLENEPSVMNKLGTDQLIIYCSDNLSGNKLCSDTTVIGNEIFTLMKVKAVYFTIWDISPTNENVLNLEPTTQNYIKNIDAINKGSTYRLIVMYESENDELSNEYEYASLQFGSRD